MKTLNAISEPLICENAKYILSYISRPTKIWLRSNNQNIRANKLENLFNLIRLSALFSFHNSSQPLIGKHFFTNFSAISVTYPKRGKEKSIDTWKLLKKNWKK